MVIVWDWNGTLLDDVDISIEAMNRVLERYGLARLNRERYRGIFGFPVRGYYERAGFDFGRVDFEKPAMEFIEEYYKLADAAELSEGAVEALNSFGERGARQLILSASERNSLAEQVRRRGIDGRFTDILGIGDHFAASKAELAAGWIADNVTDKSEVIFVGDTVHDFEVASAAGCGCLLVSCGHQSREALEEVTPNIAEDIPGAVNFILKRMEASVI